MLDHTQYKGLLMCSKALYTPSSLHNNNLKVAQPPVRTFTKYLYYPTLVAKCQAKCYTTGLRFGLRLLRYGFSMKTRSVFDCISVNDKREHIAV